MSPGIIQVVLDTNVVVSAHLNHAGFERHVLDLALSKRLQMIVSEEILAEYAGVLSRSKFGIKTRSLSRSLRSLRSAARLVRPRQELAITGDPADNRFLECAEAGRADYLVTGNKRHFPDHWRQTLIVNSRELIEWVTPDLQR